MDFLKTLNDACRFLKIRAGEIKTDVRNYKLRLPDGGVLAIERPLSGDRLYLSSFVCFLGETSRFDKLLDTAFSLGFQHGDACFSASRLTGRVVLFRNLALSNISGEQLAYEITRFSKAHQTWVSAHDQTRRTLN
ncbi:type III secretion system chaperone [Parachitinimonas caeni]|uniref:Type III secretion system chaperone n=1 Tax=Parachitinimonas caeni TaxID=3031301 RepID=A0ABT7DXT0_9NEIS|nr:type III secretion system chaperone [Parachitinimonas caeni]MDK2124875.1 type III secretion system chaperone [Parachitinimonas caeni]